ncbi:uncharacterized protein LOC110661261 isoform X2 [Hevea brasiliensis]|uniref:uncharacterized protein LOC110661261 isoform X2 n=1 Tax=Hevea brasiliensis TaxID=3981 RepID=UPI0025E98E0B|nr:uncharacterized protein LOC110661261 isoform X2 [Hevea brasiliensis]
MAPKKSSSSASPILIGNCEVTVEAHNFTCQSDPNSLQISLTKSAKIKISVREDFSRRCSDDIWESKAEGEAGRASILGDEYIFVLVNSKDSDSCSKSYLQEALKIYTIELPAMNYSANTGKQSMFLEKCVSNGKYCSLLLKSRSGESSEEAIAAITYQIVPSDTQYAEIPLAAVSSIHQHKGFGHYLYMELRKRLWSVGVRTIYCWGDKESEGFWLKQGFESIAEVDEKGRACRRLPIKADIRRALCFPGGSILMVSHLNKDTSANYVEPLKFLFPLKPHKKPSSAVAVSIHPEEGCNTLNTENQMAKSSHSERMIGDAFLGEDNNLDGFSWNQECKEPAPFEGQKCSKMTNGAELEKIEADIDVKCCSCHTQGTKRAWEASLSSLKSKRVKGSHQIDCETESIMGLDSGSGSERIDRCFNECSLGISKSSYFVGVTPTNPLTSNCMENNAKEGRSINMASEALVSKELPSKGEGVRIMLMNIADDTKKMHLSKVIEILGGIVTSDGSESTHVVTGKVRKTINFCNALCSGAWIVSSSWLKESFRKSKFVDELPYILHDEEHIVRYGTELKHAVFRAKARPRALLKGYNICLQPPVEALSTIVRSAGGNIISGLDKVNEASKTIFVACEEDMEEAFSAAKKGIRTFSSDWLINCIMKQELDLQALQFAESL